MTLPYIVLFIGGFVSIILSTIIFVESRNYRRESGVIIASILLALGAGAIIFSIAVPVINAGC